MYCGQAVLLIAEYFHGPVTGITGGQGCRGVLLFAGGEACYAYQ